MCKIAEILQRRWKINMKRERRRWKKKKKKPPCNLPTGYKEEAKNEDVYVFGDL